MKLLPRIIGRGCERRRLFMWVCVWLGVCVCARGKGERWIDGCPSGWGAGDRGRLTGCSHSLFCCSHLWHTGLPGGEQAAMVRRAQTKKTTTPPHKSHCLWKVDDEKAGGGKKEGEQNNLTGGIEKKERRRNTIFYSWCGSWQRLLGRTL